MMQSAIATLGDDYHTGASTWAHKNNYFNIVHSFIQQATCGERRTLVQAPVIRIRKGNEVPVGLPS